ncbi:MAG: hypothetical protein V4684_01340 [Pseudomonadota bacterium]
MELKSSSNSGSDSSRRSSVELHSGAGATRVTPAARHIKVDTAVKQGVSCPSRRGSLNPDYVAVPLGLPEVMGPIVFYTPRAPSLNATSPGYDRIPGISSMGDLEGIPLRIVTSPAAAMSGDRWSVGGSAAEAVSPKSPLLSRYGLTSSTIDPFMQSDPLARRRIDPGMFEAPGGALPLAIEVPRPSSIGRTLANSALLVAGAALKTVGAVYPSRQLGAAAAAALQMAFDHGRPQDDDPVTQNIYELCWIFAMSLAVAYVTTKFVAPTMKAVLTSRRADTDGHLHVHRTGGIAHDRIATALALVPFLATIGRGLMNGFTHDQGSARNAAVMAALLAASKMLIYGALRGVFERGGAKLMPTRSIVDGAGMEVPADKVVQLNLKRGLFQLPVTFAANTWLVWSILENELPDDPLSAMAGATGSYVSLWIGVYEAIVLFGDLAATAAAAGTRGWRLELNHVALPAQPEALAQVGPAAASDFIPADLHDRASEAASSIELKQWRSALNGWLKRPTPDVCMIVAGFRDLINLHLNLSFDPMVRGALDPSGVPALTIGLHALVLGLLEIAPIRLETGMAAQAAEGVGNSELFDKLHHLFKLQDLIYTQKNGRPPTDVGEAIIRRFLDPAILTLVEHNNTFDDVRTHFAALRRADEPRRAMMDRATEFMMYEPAYPTQRMVKKFGGFVSTMQFRAESRITSAVMELVRALEPW